MSGRLFFDPNKMTPNKETFKCYAAGANVVPVYTQVLADLETPVSVFSKLEARFDDCFMLESAESVDNWGRYSFLGCRPRAVFTLNDKHSVLKFNDGREIRSESEAGLEPLAPLRKFLAQRKPAKLEGLPPFFGGAVGYFGYECVNMFERLPEPKGGRTWDDARFAVYDDIVIFDNIRHTAKIVACAHMDGFPDADAAYDDACRRVAELVEIFKSPAVERKAVSGPVELRSNMSRESFCAMVEKAKQYIREGEAIQIVPSQRFSTTAKVDAVAAYRALRLINPSPYMFFIKGAGRYLVGSSPETLIRFKNGEARVRPIAGTRRRGKTREEDMRLADELLSNEKERAEHLMLVDLGRNDLSRFCKTSSVRVVDFMKIERYSHVMHIVSEISGVVKDGVDAFDALKSAFPAGTLSGAPKIRAMEIINELEPVRRGPYGGAVGYFNYSGDMDLAITIRTLQIAGGITSVQAGAGIVFDSVADFEYEETRIKSRAVASAIEAAQNIDNADIDGLVR